MTPLSKTKWTALYERLSRDDDHYGDSVSIAHQKTYLRRYADDHGYTNCHDYTDDGWSGANFDRPAWKQLIADVEAGKIDTVIVKDMSRVGRDYLQTGFYSEIYFGKQGVHFIAIDSNVDNQRSDSNEFAPILNVFNEMYLHDQSRKVKIGFHAKGKSGKHLSVTPNFGYTHDPKDPQKWFVDPIPADTVRRIFQLAADGMNPHRIAATLREEQRVTPAWYFAQQGKGNRTMGISKKNSPYEWSRGSVMSLLNAREYLGETVNFKTSKDSYKGKRRETAEDQRVTFVGTHEAIIDPATWDKAHETLNRRKVSRPAPITSPWKDKLYCAECGAPMHCVYQTTKLKNGTKQYDSFSCSTHNNAMNSGKVECVKNGFSGIALRALASDAVHAIIQYATEDEAAFLHRLHQTDKPSDAAKQLKKHIADTDRRKGELNRLLKKLYEDYALERIPESRYGALSAEYENELTLVEAQHSEYERQLELLQTESNHADRFLQLVHQYRNQTEFSDQDLLAFIDRVIVHETVRDKDGERTRKIEVHFNFIGSFSVPSNPIQLTPEEEAREAALKHRRIHERNKRKEARLAKECEKGKKRNDN